MVLLQQCFHSEQHCFHSGTDSFHVIRTFKLIEYSTKLNIFMTLNLIQNTIIISISHNNWMYLHGFFFLILVTKILRDVLEISYNDNIKTWMNYCACWDQDGMLQWLLFPIPIGVFLHGSKILCLDN